MKNLPQNPTNLDRNAEIFSAFMRVANQMFEEKEITQIEKFWMLTTVDEEKGLELPSLVMNNNSGEIMPVVAINEKELEQLKEIAQYVVEKLKRSITLVEFSRNREIQKFSSQSEIVE